MPTPQLLPLQHLGGHGPVLLILHANGFFGACYQPLAQQLQPRFTVVALDLPGQGSSAPLPPDFGPPTPAALADSLLHSIQRHGLRGCRVLGHSLGASVALLAESRQPGTFAAMYLYEPVAQAPAAPAGASTAAADGGDSSSSSSSSSSAAATASGHREVGALLAGLARRRRAEFASPAEAAERLGGKPPFSHLHPAAMAAYVHHGLRRVSPPAAQAVAAAGVGGGGGGGGGDGRLQQQSQRPSAAAWQLVTDPAVEAAVFEAFSPAPRIEAVQAVACPVLLAVGGVAEPPHDLLPGLGRALCAQLRRGRLHEWAGLGHFGPLQAPDAVARHAVAWFDEGQAASRL